MNELELYKKHLTLLLAYQTSIFSNVSFFKSDAFEPDLLHPDILDLICASNVGCSNGQTVMYDKTKAIQQQLTFKLEYQVSTFKQFLSAVESKVNLDLSQLDLELTISDLIVLIYRYYFMGDYKTRVLPYVVARVSYDTVIHSNISSLIKYFHNPDEIPKKYRAYIAASFKPTVSGSYRWVYNKKKSIEIQEIYGVERRCTEFESFLATLFPDLQSSKIKAAMSYAHVSGKYKQEKVPLIETSTPEVERFKVIGLGVEPTFKPQKISRYDVIIDDVTSSEKSIAENHVLYTAGWSLKRDNE
ncbi:hypothetical protein [Vibrio sp. B1Z05]|uniref:hypothetical protein n=1 Tax=Vibrio sp. B1Z05 TaxID=2654980 RepID=UPI00128C3FD6|nr:hypothetical protein [Vibrio sp. B1Z05]MPW37299.1 hypothetical protein [Vibrio sp. B1Z05]